MADDLSPYLVKIAKGKVLFKEGDAGEEMYFIQSGKVRIEKEVAGAIETLAVMEKGDFFGEMALIDNIPRTASAVIEDDAELLKVNSSNFETLLQSNIEIAIRMIRKYSARLRDSNAKLDALRRDRKEVDEEIQEILTSVKKGADEEGAAGKVLAQFIGPKDVAYPIAMSEVTIGRTDPVTGIVPDVDLTSIDQMKSVSRKHARLMVVQDQFLLTEEIGVANGTIVNGQKLTAGEPMTLAENAKVSFGKVILTFTMAPSKN